MRATLVLGFAALYLLAPAPASAAEGIGKIVDGVPAANKKVGTPNSLIDPDLGLSGILCARPG